MCGFTNACRTNHEAMNVAGVHQSYDRISGGFATEDEALYTRQILALPPQFRLKRHLLISLPYFRFCGEPGCSMLAVADCSAFDTV